MGLAGRKQKQRIPADPRNLSWANDASRFGLSYLSKFGWDASQGLGSSGEGMKSHVKVQQKLDMTGIGAQHQQDPNGIAWKQNKEFEALLKRLNEVATQEEGVDDQGVGWEGMTDLQAGIGGEMLVGVQEEKVEEISRDGGSAMTMKKRKHKDGFQPDCEEDSRKKRKKKKEKHGSDIPSVSLVGPNFDSSSTQSSAVSRSNPMSKSRPMAHRARIRAAKRIADKSASAISEILGIASSSASTSISTPVPTPPSWATPEPQPSSLSLDNLTTSTRSVADYFKEKLLARPTTFSSLSSTPQAPSGSTTPSPNTSTLRAGSSHSCPLGEEEVSRKGIGSMASVPPSSQTPGLGSDSADCQKMAKEETHRRAERKAEKRKRREAEARQLICESSVKQQVEEDRMENVQETSKKKKRQERNQQAHVDDDSITKKDCNHDTTSRSFAELRGKIKKC